ncbi:lysylphosphatidylglycerol synthase transmembrane domain-containing protein [Silvibacterium acidisoli]|uniref:lysylphosphatidylglycerol synthase transmembrane domain-containing protein n=1 Tax=Acidobacteriaceae bacterium ZG23-2 TaxID=2883246 RepID=UPI00406BE4DD
MKKNQLILGVLLIAVLIGLAAYAQHKHPFDFRAFGEQFRLADWRLIAVALGCIYLGYVIRGIRWALLLRHNKKVPVFSLLGTQVIGFTAVALTGRVADLVRPYLVSKKTALPLSSQIAVYVVERLFDAGSMALIFSSVILLAPKGALPHPEVFRKVGYWGLLGTVCGVVFLVALRISGEFVAGFFQRLFGLVSKNVGASVGDKIRSFRVGLDTLRSPADLLIALVLSLVMWGLITVSYVETARSFVASPELASLTLAQGMVLMVSSGVASVIQLPIVGWFTQIGIVAETLGKLFNVSPESATACAATLLIVTFLGIIPVGLIWARVERISLTKVTEESEHADAEAAA